MTSNNFQVTLLEKVKNIVGSDKIFRNSVNIQLTSKCKKKRSRKLAKKFYIFKQCYNFHEI